MNANERRQAIWHTLCARRRVTISFLATEHQVSRTTIKCDIYLLSLSYPIVTSKGFNGGVKLADWYVPGRQLLTPKQMNLLLRLAKTLCGEDAQIMRSIITQLSEPAGEKIEM